MFFNSDRSKQAQDIIFSRKTSIQSHPVLAFDNILVQNYAPKHLGLILDEQLNLKSKAYKGTAVLRKFQDIISKNFPKKSFIRPHLHYGDIIYHQPNYRRFWQKMNLFNTKQH